jgi:uncharacterized protein (DUF433 family)
MCRSSLWRRESRFGIRYHEAMKWEDRIVASPDVLVGKPVVKGTRLAVEFIVDLLAGGWTQEQILGRRYSGLSRICE